MNSPGKTNRFRVALLLIPILFLATFVFFPEKDPVPPPELFPPPAIPEKTALAPLGSEPDWRKLDIFQNTITRAEFRHLLNTVYTKDAAWKPWIDIHEDHADIRTRTHDAEKNFRLDFAAAPPARIPRFGWKWKRAADLSPAPPGKPLQGLHIALDPGHIGGKFAKMEERDLRYGDHKAIREGEMTLLTCRKLAPMLEKMGAKVTLVRKKNAPVTTLRPHDFRHGGMTKKSAEKLFYRTAEIHARADLINEKIQPDLVLCLHYNATASPVPVPGQHYHLLINGAYHASELAHDDERFQMLTRLLSRTYEEELPLSRRLAAEFSANTGLPPFQYSPTNPYALNLDHDPALWARNLLANRSYHCPVLYFEPYVMNSPEFIKRHEMGDYESLKKIDGVPRPSLYREYARSIAHGLADYFASRRGSDDKK